MTDKQQIIEEMVDAMAISCGECYSCQFSGKRNNKVSCTDYLSAEALYNAGYRKVDENAVVLTREEKQKLLHEMYEQGKFDIFIELGSTVYDNTRKETAKEIITDIRSCMKDFEDDDGYLLKKCEFDFFMREIAKQFGVEVD